MGDRLRRAVVMMTTGLYVSDESLNSASETHITLYVNQLEFKKNFFSTFIYFWDRERQSMNGGGAEREGDTESETGSRL